MRSGVCAATSSTYPPTVPRRDERLGWTGDLQVFAPTAAFLYDVSGFVADWLEDLRSEQLESGQVPMVVPIGTLGPIILGNFAAAVWGGRGDGRSLDDVHALRGRWPLGPAVRFDARLGGFCPCQGRPSSAVARGSSLAGRLVGPRRTTGRVLEGEDGCGVGGDGRFRARSRPRRPSCPDPRSTTGGGGIRAARRGGATWPFGRSTWPHRAAVSSDSVTAYALAIVFGLCENASQREKASERIAFLSSGAWVHHLHRLRRHSHRAACSDRNGRCRDGLPPPDRDGVSIVAESRHYGRDDGLGAMGQPASGRVRQLR